MRRCELANGKRFDFVLRQDGVFVKCVDPFEEVFGLSTEILGEADFMDVLEPKTIPVHKEIVDKMVDVYFDLSQEYGLTYAKPKEVRRAAVASVMQKYGMRKEQLKGSDEELAHEVEAAKDVAEAEKEKKFFF